jgi:hypothetical protein
MTGKELAALLGAGLSVGLALTGCLAVSSASAGDLHPRRFHIDGLRPGGPDPYAYSYERRAYYPSYRSDYWAPQSQMRYRYRAAMRLPEYRSTWGYPLRCKVQGRHNCGVPYTGYHEGFR